MLELSEKDSVVFADFTIYTILRYLTKIEGMRPDMTLITCDEKTNIRDRVDTIKHLEYVFQMYRYYPKHMRYPLEHGRLSYPSILLWLLIIFYSLELT